MLRNPLAFRLNPNGRDRIVVLLSGFVSASLILFWSVSMAPQYAYDDAYITYRYADNLRNGLGLTYNPGESVLGTTSPLFAILLGTLGRFIGDIELLGHWLGAISWIIAAWAVIALFRQAGHPAAGNISALLIAVQPAILSSLGMETPLVLALMIASAWAWMADKKPLAAVLTAVLLMTRADGALWALLLGLETWRVERKPPWREGLITVAILSPWLAFAQITYGSFVPNSINAKIGQTQLMPVGGQESFLTELVNSLAVNGSAVLWTVAVSALIGLWAIARRSRRLWWLAAWLLSYVMIYTWLGAANFPWYFTPPISILGLLAAFGMGTLLGDKNPTRPSPGQSPITSPLKFPLMVTAIVLLAILIPSLWSRASSIQRSPSARHTEAYRPTGIWLSENTSEEATVAAIEIGVIGYLSQRHILDTMGLVSKEMTNRQFGWVETLVYAVGILKPDYAIVLPRTGWDWMLDQWWFAESYQPVANFDRVSIYQLRERRRPAYNPSDQAEFVNGLVISGASFGKQELEPGTKLDLDLHFEVHQELHSRYQLTVYLIDTRTDERFSVTSMEPFNGGYPTHLWQPGDLLSVPARMDLPLDLATGTYRLGILLFDTNRGGTLPMRNNPLADFTEARIGWLRVGHPPVPTRELSFRSIMSNTSWQEGIELVNLSLPENPSKAGEVFELHLDWQTTQSLTRDLTVFVHFIDNSGAIIAQQDQKPLAGRFPTPGWRPGEILHDVYRIKLPETLESGNYGLRIGFYDGNGRLALADGSGDILLLPDIVQIAAP